MSCCRPVVLAAMCVWLLVPATGRAQTSIELVVAAGRPIRIALDARVRVGRVGQPVTGAVVNDIYAYDRIVVPAGTRVSGRVAALQPASAAARGLAILAGNFSSLTRPVLTFDRLIFPDGRALDLQTTVGPASEGVTLATAPSSLHAQADDEDGSAAAHVARTAALVARDEAGRRARAVVAAIARPGRLERVRGALINRLPYHPTYLEKGTVVDAELDAPLSFGTAHPTRLAPLGTAPAPDSVLNVSLVTAVNSATTEKGTTIEAVLAEPVFTDTHELVLPEGTVLTGEVTLSRRARRLHRDGQLRFHFESVHLPGQEAQRLLAGLYAAQVHDDGSVSVDDEGGVRGVSSKTRFVAPVLALTALTLGLSGEETHIEDGRAVVTSTGTSALPLGAGGFVGWGLAGSGLGLASRPAGIALTLLGVARSVYGAVFGMGRDVSFGQGTPLQVQLAPGRAQTP